MRNRGLVIGLGGIAAALLCWPGMPEAATYQLQVASVPERVFMYFVEGHILPRAEAFLDDTGRSKFVLFRDRQPQLLELVAADQSAPWPVNVTLPKPHNPWGVMTWDGEGGQLAVFHIRGKQSNYQKLRRVAVQADEVLTRFPVRRIPASPPWRMQVPATAASYLVRALESGAFAAWAKRRAVSYDGLSVIVGRHHDPQQSDTVYLVVRMPQDGQSYKVVLGWENFEHESGYGNDQGRQDR